MRQTGNGLPLCFLSAYTKVDRKHNMFTVFFFDFGYAILPNYESISLIRY